MAKKKKNVQTNELDQSIAASVSFFEKHQKPILYCGGTILAIVIAALLIHQFVITPRNQHAREAIYHAEQQFQNGNYEAALNGNEEGMGFLEVADKYGWTKVANLAHLYAGLCYERLGQYEEAVAQLEDFSGKGDAMISPAAIGALGNCYAPLGDMAKAAETLLSAAKKADNSSLSPTFLMHAGQLFESLEQNDKALECYQTIKKKYQQSLEYTNVDKYIEALSK